MLPLIALNILLTLLLAAALYAIFFSPRLRHRRAQAAYVLLFTWPLLAALANTLVITWSSH
jgi:cbb3-type cytochrome oxidase subunit 3